MTANELDRYMRMFWTNVYSVALCRCKNPSDADDIAQDVFLALYTYKGSFTDDEHIKAWLLRCAINRSINVVRSYRHRFSVPLEAAEDRTVEMSANENTELLETVMKLKKKNGIVMYLHYYEGYDAGEIAVMLHISEAAVRSRLFRGREQLRKLLEGERNL